MDSDGHSELMLWTPWDKHYIFTVADIRALDAADQNIDGHAELTNLEQASLKIWSLEDLETLSPRSQTILQSEESLHDTAIIQFNTAIFSIDFAKLATLDDPIESKRDFEIETLNRLGSEGLTLMEVPLGIRFREEFGGFLPIGDFDGDGDDDLLVNFNGGKTVYLIASVDLVNTANQVDNPERKVGIQNVLEKGNSYTLDQFLTPKNHARTTQLSPKRQRNQQQLILISPAFGSNTTYLVNLMELALHDREDGEMDGFVSTINVADTNSWQIDGLGHVELCNDGIAEENTYILGLRSSFAAREIFVFQLKDLADYVDTSGSTENRIHIDDLLFSSSVKIWQIQPHVESSSIEKTEVSCIGDWNDDETDFAITLNVVNPAYTQVLSRRHYC